MTRTQLSDAQAVILSTACARGDGTVFPVTTGLKGGAVGNVCKSLLKRGLIEEVAARNLVDPRHTGLVLLCGVSEHDLQAQARQAGAVALLEKPISSDNLLSVIQK